MFFHCFIVLVSSFTHRLAIPSAAFRPQLTTFCAVQPRGLRISLFSFFRYLRQRSEALSIVEFYKLQQARSHGGRSGAVPPKLCAQKKIV